MFAKQAPASTETRPVPATGTKSGPFSLIGGDVTIEGKVSASVDLHVDGRIEGDVACAALVQGPDSVVKGDIVAKTARIAGTVEGSVTADELVIERTARIAGDCTYGSIQVASGARLDGRLSSRQAAPELKVVAKG